LQNEGALDSAFFSGPLLYVYILSLHDHRVDLKLCVAISTFTLMHYHS